MTDERLKRGAYRTLANNGLLGKYLALRLRTSGSAASIATRLEKLENDRANRCIAETEGQKTS